MTDIEKIKKLQKQREKKFFELMAHFDEQALRNWIHEFWLRHQSYKSGLKYDFTNICLSFLIEDDMARNIHLLEFKEFYNGMREAWRTAQGEKFVIPSYINGWFISTLAPDHCPPQKKYSRRHIGLFEHVTCYCIYTASKYSPFKANRDDKNVPNSICDFVAEEIGLDFTTVKRMWRHRDRDLFPKIKRGH